MENTINIGNQNELRHFLDAVTENVEVEVETEDEVMEEGIRSSNRRLTGYHVYMKSLQVILYFKK